MNDQINADAITSEDASVDFDADFFDDWIEGASPSRRSVTIYGNPGLFAEYQQIQRDLEVARAAAKAGGDMAGSGVAALQQREADLYAEWMASKTTWFVQRLDPDASDRIKTAMTEAGFVDPPEPEAPEAPVPPTPPVLPDNASEKQQRTHTVRMQQYEAEKATHEAKLPAYEAAVQAFEAAYPEWDKAHEKYVDEANYRMVVEGFLFIQDSDGDTKATSITVAQLRKLAAKLGSAQILKLTTAITAATINETELQAPFSPSTSETDPT